MTVTPHPTEQGQDPTTEDAHRWVVRLASGSVTSEDLAGLRAWLDADARHRTAFDQARETWQMAEALAEDLPADAAGPAHGEPGAIVPGQPRGRRVSRPAIAAVTAIAATVLLVAISAGDLLIRLRSDLGTASGEVRAEILPDGSQVTLNTDSAIAVDFSRTERRIALLRGEAMFEVRSDPGRPFLVTAFGGDTRAVGTAFSVAGFDERVAVAVAEGIVRVSSPSGGPAVREITLQAGESGSYAEGGPPERGSALAATDIAPWRDGRIVFDNRPFADAVAELDRYFPGRILVLGSVPDDRPVSAVFSVDAVDGAIVALAEIQDLQVLRLTDYLVVLR